MPAGTEAQAGIFYLIKRGLPIVGSVTRFNNA